jgi:hypothetical protein
VLTGCVAEPEEWYSTVAAREKSNGAGGGLQGSGRPVWLSFCFHKLMLVGSVASNVVSLNVRIGVMLRAVLFHEKLQLHLLLACFD